MTTLDDVMAEAIRLTRNATNEDTLRMIAAIEAYGDTRAAEEREACARILDGVTSANPMTAGDCADTIRARGE